MTEGRTSYATDKASDERRVVRVLLDVATLAHLLRGGSMVKLDAGIPEDARCVGVSHDVMSNGINVFFEHPSFDVIEPAYWAPAVMASITLDGDYEQVLLRRVWDEFNAEADAMLMRTGTTAGTHYNGLMNVLRRRGVEVAAEQERSPSGR